MTLEELLNGNTEDEKMVKEIKNLTKKINKSLLKKMYYNNKTIQKKHKAEAYIKYIEKYNELTVKERMYIEVKYKLDNLKCGEIDNILQYEKTKEGEKLINEELEIQKQKFEKYKKQENKESRRHNMSCRKRKDLEEKLIKEKVNNKYKRYQEIMENE